MASIAENMASATRENAEPFNVIERIDNLTRLVVQSRAVVTSMIADDNFTNLTPTTLSNLLWLLQDRLEEIESIVPGFNRGMLQ